ncbi:MAG TPA: hypothetical protein VM784_11070 [Actinomycetota bacterium]|nr:hypothetical protein [Actinomycetota bacterium]
MKGLALRHRVVLVGAALLGLALYLVIVDFGINAGRIHHGVRVGDIDVGGMVEADAVELLAEVGAEMRNAPIAFSAEGLNFNFTPREFGWLPLERPSAARAHEVGRAGGVMTALSDRLQATWSGVTVRWPDELNRVRIGTRLNALERKAEALGYALDRPEMWRRIKRAIWSWPRPTYYEIPVTRG